MAKVNMITNSSLGKIKHSTQKDRYSSEGYSRFFQTKGGMNISEFEKHLKK